ncbi:uncharacterized protein M421DRAFT_417418 [Didymella exigua CBS 183.55]|uniref:Uncharacterized protein n=1 Tax=Didymella exigua CBS 183.55 TaxID=1150837 RepID=A0A6A5RUW1_9PLEO|nr:uncharacterized protein M421DRAFT_417418 [Didymella exigua CBS 183.55]KAF1931652.1 hypothetical protein M421DRAFT_417418 [Didymella exigua CBS 183.55]
MHGVESSSLRLLLPSAKHNVTYVLTTFIDVDIAATHTADILYTASMERRSTISGIGMALKQQRDTLSSVDAEGVRPLSARGTHDRLLPDAPISAWLSLGVDDAPNKTSATDIDDLEGHKPSMASPTKDSVFKDFCRGQPPRRSFLASGMPPRLPVSRRSTLADKPELDTLLKVFTIQFKNEDFLPINENTVHLLNQYMNGSKPLAHTCRFKRLLFNSKTNEVRVGLFVKVLENIGMYCEHLAIVAPFHPIEFGNTIESDIGNSEPGSDWEKILDCLHKLRSLTFEHPDTEPTHLTRDTFYTLTCALATNKILQKSLSICLDVPPKVFFNYHKDHHSSLGSTPLCLVGADMVYADGPEGFGSLDNDPVFGKAEDISSTSGSYR